MSNLNAIEKNEGPCVILAGAGTGKTHTLIEKVKVLVNSGKYKHDKIVCITFSNEAANSLKARLMRELDERKEIKVETFHAFSADLLRKYGKSIDLEEDFNIITPDEAKVILNRSLRVQPYYCHRYVGSIGMAKDLGITLEAVKKYVERENVKYTGIDIQKKLEELNFELQTLHLNKKKDKLELLKKIKELKKFDDVKKFTNIWNAYEKIKKKHKYLDYSDLNVLALELLRKNKEITSDYEYVIVDEFQDTNKVQLDFLVHFCLNKNITVVGDANQSIYRFRGAYKENFHTFKKFFNVSENEIYNLDKSFRSPDRVLRIANELIRKNYENPNECFEVKNVHGIEGDKVEVYEMKNGHEEARKVIEVIKKSIDDGMKLEDICIMYRTHQQGRVIKMALQSEGIEFNSVSKKSLFAYSPVKTVIDYLTIIDSLNNKKKGNEQAWWDLFYRSNIGQKDLITIGKFMKANRENECISQLIVEDYGKIAVSDIAGIVIKSIVEKIKSFTGKNDIKLVDLLKEIYRVVLLIENEPEEKSEENAELVANLKKFSDLAEKHSALYSNALSDFIHYLDILKNLGIEIESAKIDEKGVRLMTIHATKGLEYGLVIITNMAQKRFPIEDTRINSLIPLELYPEHEHLKDIEESEKENHVKNYEIHHNLLEERRLCYVSFTRAKKKLVLMYAQEYGGKKHFPSQFLQEINYKKNDNCNFVIDLDEKYSEKVPEIKSALELNSVIYANDFDDININGSVDERKEFNINKLVLSPSALLLFDECQKKYEYKYVYNMPDEKTVNWDAINLGSFVHLILEQGIKNNFKSLREFLDLMHELHLKEEWAGVDSLDSENMIKVFFERNRNKYNEKTLTEQQLRTKIAGFNFLGYADRIDFHDDGIEIIDYKTGRTVIAPKHRNWQLGYYALASSKYGKVKRLTLDMLKQEKPLEFEIDSNGIAHAVDGRMEFSIAEVEDELISTAHRIADAYKNGFKPCSVDKNCEFCNEYVYGL